MRIKAELSSRSVLVRYSPNYETVVSADVSSNGLGAVLTQRQPDTCLFRPVVYLSRSLTDTERRYSQIEKEALATTWACERLSNYLIGLPFTVETDHKPLVALPGTKALDELLPRVLPFRLRLMRCQFNIVHVPGKNLITADALSRAPTDVSSVADSAVEQEVDAFMAAVTDSLPATDQRLQDILTELQDDPICMTIESYCSVGWPPEDRLPAALKPYWPASRCVNTADALCNAPEGERGDCNPKWAYQLPSHSSEYLNGTHSWYNTMQEINILPFLYCICIFLFQGRCSVMLALDYP